MASYYKLVKARESAGLSQQELAKTIGVQQDQLAMWETGRSRPYPAHLRRIAEVTKRSLAWFQGEDELFLDLAGTLPEQTLKRLRELSKDSGRSCAEEAIAAIIEYVERRKSTEKPT